MTVERRGFLRTAAFASSLLAGGRLPVLAADDGRAKTRVDAGTGPYALKPIKGYLAGNPALAGGALDGDDYTLTCDVLVTSGPVDATHEKVSTVGRLVIARKRQAGAGPRYDVRQETYHAGTARVLDAGIACADDDVGTLLSWTTLSRRVARRGRELGKTLSRTRETGSAAGGRISLEGVCDRAHTARNPLVSNWTVLDFLARRATPRTDLEVDCLRELSRFHPGRVLRYDGEVKLPRRGGRAATLRSYVHFGHATAATHFLTDARGLPQLVTGFQVSWALRSVG